MLTSVGVSGFLVVISIIVFIFLCYRGLHTGVAALVAAIIVAFGTADGIIVSMFETFCGGIGQFLTTMFPIFTVAGLLGYLMDKTGASEALGKKLIAILGKDRAPLILSLTTVLLLLAGVGTYVYIVVVLSNSLMKAANLPRRIGLLACVGIAPSISYTLPLPNLPNALPTSILGTSVFSAPILSVATCVVGVTLFFFYMNYAIKKARANGEGFDGPTDNMLPAEAAEKTDLPPFSTSVATIAVVIGMALLLIQVGVDSTYASSLALLCGAGWVMVVNFGRVKKLGFIKTISAGASGNWGFLVMAGCVMGFGQVVQQSAAFQPIIDLVFSIEINPYATAMLSVMIVAGLCADGITAMMMWLSIFGTQYAAMPGVDPNALHRLLVNTTQTFDSLPHSQSTAISLSVFGLTHKEGYGGVFITTVIIPTIFSVFCCICCIIFY